MNNIYLLLIGIVSVVPPPTDDNDGHGKICQNMQGVFAPGGTNYTIINMIKKGIRKAKIKQTEKKGLPQNEFFIQDIGTDL